MSKKPDPARARFVRKPATATEIPLEKRQDETTARLREERGVVLRRAIAEAAARLGYLTPQTVAWVVGKLRGSPDPATIRDLAGILEGMAWRPMPRKGGRPRLSGLLSEKDVARAERIDAYLLELRAEGAREYDILQQAAKREIKRAKEAGEKKKVTVRHLQKIYRKYTALLPAPDPAPSPEEPAFHEE